MPLDNRENAKMGETCYKLHSATVNPIIDWDDSEVWEFIREYKIPYCNLYDKGYKCLGCIGCPMSSKQKEEFENYPKYKNLYLLAFQKMLDKRKERNIINKSGWETPEEVMNWWLQL